MKRALFLVPLLLSALSSFGQGTGEVQIWLMNGTTPTSTGLGSYPLAWVVAGVGDFNGDGTADLLWRNNSTGEVDIWLMSGTAVASSTSLGTFASNWVIAGVGDFNGDRKADILWQNTSTGETDLWIMNGAAIVSSTNLGNYVGWGVQAVGDFNGDGKADILWRNSGTTGEAGYQVDLSWNAPASGSDPVTGYAVYRSPSGQNQWALLGSTVSGMTAFNDLTVVSGQSYDYQVTSVDAQGLQSAPSNTWSVAIP